VRSYRDHSEDAGPLFAAASNTAPEGDTDLAYRLWLSGWSGRALWQIEAPAAGRYTLLCHNHGVFSNVDLPADDRIALLRDPPSFVDVRRMRTIVVITGGTLTITAVIIFYLLHILALDKR
jgi:hypothetical protein